MASLLFEAGPNAGRRYRLGEGDYIVGRRSDCQIFVPDMRVSRQHARIRRSKGTWVLEDLGSNNGTYLNDARINQEILKHDDAIVIAGNVIRVDMPKQSNTGSIQYDANVTIVDLKNPQLIIASEDSSDFGFMSASLAGAQDDQREQKLLERKLNALTSLLEVSANTSNADQLLEELVERLLDVFPKAHTVGVLVKDEKSGDFSVKSRRERKPSENGFLKVPGTIIRHVVKDKRGVLLSTHSVDPNELSTSGSRMGAPLQAQEHNYGVIYVEGDKQNFKQEDVDLLTSIAAHAGLAIHSTKIRQHLRAKERMERDLRVARQIQRSLLPHELPEVVGLKFAVHYEPAYQIGGDFYDFIWHDKTHLGFVVGDVAGKAISAALYMASLTSQLRSRAGLSRTPARLLRYVNKAMLHLGDDGMFATLAYFIYELDTKTLLFTNAGHMVPLLFRNGTVYPLNSEVAHVAPIGIMEDMELGEARVQLHAGDMLVLTTDGIHEARDKSGNEYGVDRLSDCIIKSAQSGPDKVVDTILKDVDAHVGGNHQSDDITIFAMSVGNKRARRQTEPLAINS